MPITTGDFQDLVQLSQDTLYYVGPDLEIGNTSVGSSASIGFNNTEGDIQLVGVPRSAGTVQVFLPTNSGTLLTNINVSAGTTSNNLSNVVLSNSNGLQFGLNSSTVTAALYVSSFQNGAPITTYNALLSNNQLSLQPVFIPYNITVTDILWLSSASNNAGSGGVWTISAGLYSLNGGSSGSLSLASSQSTTGSYASSVSSNFTGVNYGEMSMASWAVTAGAWVFAWAISAASMSVSLYGTASGTIPIRALVTGSSTLSITSLVLAGISETTVAALPGSIAVSNTNYLRGSGNGSNAYNQPWIVMQGT